MHSRILTALFVLIWLAAGSVTAAEPAGQVTASATADGFSPAGPIDGDRFSVAPESVWMGTAKRGSVWQMTFDEPTAIGSILQIHSDDEYWLKNAPRNYVWQTSDDGTNWSPLAETVVHQETRLFRVHRLKQPVTTKHIRLLINLAYGAAPALREIEFYPEVDAPIPFDDWIVVVSSDEDPDNHGAGMPFVQLARKCEGWNDVSAQHIWHGDFDEVFLSVEPRPMCAFFSGSSLEWCQCSREPWRGVQEVLKSRTLPMWGACGGAQVFAILEETGVDRPWDCPRCRKAGSPLSPIYSHIGHKGAAPCGDYSQSIGERGIFTMKIEREDPVFEGLPEEFAILESHIGQINHVPEGWHRLVTKGPGAHTVNQCLRVDDYPIYAAQFHMESFESTLENSRQIMSNFLQIAREWNQRVATDTPASP